MSGCLERLQRSAGDGFHQRKDEHPKKGGEKKLKNQKIYLFHSCVQFPNLPQLLTFVLHPPNPLEKEKC